MVSTKTTFPDELGIQQNTDERDVNISSKTSSILTF